MTKMKTFAALICRREQFDDGHQPLLVTMQNVDLRLTQFFIENKGDRDRFNRFFHSMLRRGIYLAPSAFEAGFVSAAHTSSDIATTVAAARATFTELVST